MATASVAKRAYLRAVRYDEVLLAAMVLLLAQGEIWTGSTEDPGVFAALSVPMAVALLWWRKAPLGVLAVVIGSQLLGALIDVSFAPLYQLFSFLFACFAVAARTPLPSALIGLVAAEAMFIVGGLLDSDAKTAGDWLFVTGAVIGTWFVGRTLYRRDRVVDLLEDRFGRQNEETRQLIRAEQDRIAREVHDVLAHTVSVMVVQAAAAEQLVGDNHAACEALGHIQRSGHEAVLELRRLLLMLRGDFDSGSPQPGLGDLPALIDSMREGLAVEASLDIGEMALPPVIELAVYRIVQEALTNVRKHARGATRVTVDLRLRSSRIDIHVVDDGVSAGPALAGNGLLGIRERARLYGGDATAAAHPDGGFAVSAWMTTEPADGHSPPR